MARGSPRSLLLLVALQGRGHRTLGGAGWMDLRVFRSSELELELEGNSELKSRGLVARFGVDMNLRLFCNLGYFYGSGKRPHWRAMRSLHEC